MTWTPERDAEPAAAVAASVRGMTPTLDQINQMQRWGWGLGQIAQATGIPARTIDYALWTAMGGGGDRMSADRLLARSVAFPRAEGRAG